MGQAGSGLDRTQTGSDRVSSSALLMRSLCVEMLKSDLSIQPEMRLYKSDRIYIPNHFKKSDLIWFLDVQMSKNQAGYNLDMPEIKCGLAV